VDLVARGVVIGLLGLLLLFFFFFVFYLNFWGLCFCFFFYLIQSGLVFVGKHFFFFKFDFVHK